MSGTMRKFREWSPEQSVLFPVSPRDWLPENHLVYFLLEVSAELDLEPLLQKYAGELGGQPPFHPRMMLTLLLYSYCVGVFSSRKIAARCETDIAFRVIVGGEIPDFRTISEFRRRHLDSIQHLFVEVLRMCREAGLLKVGRVALDGTKVKANASRHKAMSYDRMNSEEQRLEREIAELLQQAQAADATDDATLGDRRGDELPDELGRREQRLKKIRAAKAALEEQARAKAAVDAAARKAEGRPPAKIAPQDAVPDPKDQRNFTDPESRIMKTSNKGWDQCGNAQAVANEAQIILAADVTDQANDCRQVEPMIEQTCANLTVVEVPDQIDAFSTDAGYFSEANVIALEAHERIGEAYLAPGRLKHHQPLPATPKGRIPKSLSVKERMARKLRTQRGRKEYARRKAIIEPVFGQIKQCRGFRQFLMRGLNKMKAEWKLVCLTHNLLKLFRNAARATT